MATTTQPDPARTGRLLLLLILSVASALIMNGLAKDLPFAAEVDEAHFVSRALRMVQQQTLNPRWFGHPGSTIMYPLAAMYAVMHRVAPSWCILEAPTSKAVAFEPKAWPFYLAGRLLNIAYHLGCIVLIYLVGRRVFDAATGLAGAWFFAINPLVLRYASVIRTDLAATFFALLALLFCLELAARPSLRARVLAGLAAGLALSSRYFMVAVLPVLPLAELAAVKNYPPGRRALRWIGWSALLGFVAFAGFALSSPYALIRYDITLRNLAGEGRTTHLGADGLTPAGNLLWYVTTLLPRNVSWMFIVLAAVGLLLVLQQRRTFALIFAAHAGLLIVAICLPYLHWDRWIIPALPFFSLLAAHALAAIFRRCAARRPALRRCEALLLALLTVIVSARAARCAVEDSILSSQPGTRIAALNWLRANTPPGARIFHEGQTLPEQGELYTAHGCYALGRDWLEQPARHLYYDYVVANSRMYERYYVEPERYADELAVYEWLRTRCRLAAEFTPSPAQAGPTIRIYAMPRPAPEEAAP